MSNPKINVPSTGVSPSPSLDNVLAPLESVVIKTNLEIGDLYLMGEYTHTAGRPMVTSSAAIFPTVARLVDIFTHSDVPAEMSSLSSSKSNTEHEHVHHSGKHSVELSRISVSLDESQSTAKPKPARVNNDKESNNKNNKGKKIKKDDDRGVVPSPSSPSLESTFEVRSILSYNVGLSLFILGNFRAMNAPPCIELKMDKRIACHGMTCFPYRDGDDDDGGGGDVEYVLMAVICTKDGVVHAYQIGGNPYASLRHLVYNADVSRSNLGVLTIRGLYLGTLLLQR